MHLYYIDIRNENINGGDANLCPPFLSDSLSLTLRAREFESPPSYDEDQICDDVEGEA